MVGCPSVFNCSTLCSLPCPLQARKAVEARSQITQKLAHKQREDKEDQMRLLAQKARDQRAGIRSEAISGACVERGTVCVVRCRVDVWGTCGVVFCTVEEDADLRERDDLRHERHRERERQRRLEKAGK